jgi:hypothetical protein
MAPRMCCALVEPLRYDSLPLPGPTVCAAEPLVFTPDDPALRVERGAERVRRSDCTGSCGSDHGSAPWPIAIGIVSVGTKLHPVCATVKYRLTSQFTPARRGSRIAAVTFPWGCGSQPGTTIPRRPDVGLDSNTPGGFATGKSAARQADTAPAPVTTRLSVGAPSISARRFESTKGSTTFRGAGSLLRCASRRVYSGSYRRYIARDHLRLCHRRFE